MNVNEAASLSDTDELPAEPQSPTKASKPELPPKPSFLSNASKPPSLYPSLEKETQPSLESGGQHSSTASTQSETTISPAAAPTPPERTTLRNTPTVVSEPATPPSFATTDLEPVKNSEQEHLIPSTTPDSTLAKFHLYLLILILLLCLALFGVVLTLFLKHFR
ncbi:hypothetical protein Tcan_11428 [Toxocara canis]|uniref:Uncharacterized protein n=1 Tax=Toxocara canis TaxID=6265 RepID=A0A0B2VUK9_TOXCA|nr:hypothetical protein Tcan_11428 [Toxocara canis]